MQIVTAASQEKGARVFSCEYDFGKTVQDSIKKFGEELVKNKLDAQLKVDIQGYIRRMLKADKSDKDIAEGLKTWQPSLKKAGKSAGEKMDDLWGKLSPEEKKAQLAKWAGK